MNFKLKNILLGGIGLIGVTAIGLSAACDKTKNTPENPGDGNPANETGGQNSEPIWVTNPEYGKINLLGIESTMNERVLNATGNKANNKDVDQYSQEERKQIIIGHTFSQGSVQSDGIDQLINVYNKLVQQNNEDFKKYKEQNPNDQDGINFKSKVGLSLAAKPVTTAPLGSGYSAGAQSVQQAVKNGNPNFADIVLNYAPVASTLASRNMLLSFNDDDPELNVDLYNFNSEFSSINAETQNVDKISSWILPGLKSTNVLAINSPVMSYILTTILENGGKIQDNDTEMTTLYNTIKQKGTADLSEVKKNWGEPVDNIKDLAKGKVISSTMFKHYQELLEFSSFAQSLFKNSATTNPVKANVHVFGVDSATSLYEQALFSILDGDTSKMIQSVNRNRDGVTISYTTLNKNGTPANVNSQTIYNALSEAVKSGGTKLFPGGRFSSNDQQKHKFAFSIGSTAGYNHNFVKGEFIEYNYTQDGKSSNGLSFDDKKGSFTDIQQNYGKGYQLLQIPTEPGTTDIQADTPLDKILPLYKIGGRLNPIFAYNLFNSEAAKKAGNINKIAKYATMFKSQEDQTHFAAQINDVLNTKDSRSRLKTTGFLVLPYDEKKDSAFLAKAKELNLFGGLITTGLTEKDQTSIILVFKDGVTSSYGISDTAKAEFTKLGYTVSQKSQAQFLGEDELISLPTPTKWNKDNTKNVVFGQGPSIMGIVSNAVDQLATKQFIKWLISSTDKYVFDPDDETKPEFTPRDFIQKQMSYVMPYNGFENVTIQQANESFIGTNAYLRVAFELFQKVAKDDSYILFEEPGSEMADAYRSAIDSAFDALQTSIESGQKIQGFDQFIKKIQQESTKTKQS
ncbi:P80 family lipoprotein [Mycoplasmopsis verecunda]|uniref:P68 family surface lipoprotein n=1 Tax=Mycoplasmopsis verecunda TaxID=171291 RepID=UPI00298D05DD|nr:P80 family lipoprotein [Mycoplasmopsis verecunda]WPB54756.1 P80 family lipoprotein [Mycoplasmopsis verecunda]